MSTFPFPTVGRAPSDCNVRYAANTDVRRSPLNGAIQTLKRSRGYWVIDYSYRNLTNAERQILSAWLANLDGMRHRFTSAVPGSLNTGAYGGTPLVAGADQTGNTINIDGASPSVTGWANAGDYLSFGGQLKMVTADVNTDGGGAASIPVTPEFATAPADNAAVLEADWAGTGTGQFVLQQNSVSWSTVPGRDGHRTNLTFSAIEDVT